ncbi:hypothetical protein HDU87_005691 [Geranomyces variabilis]|uniref:Uncharacterized protein n=1 Tax=Geranomyces variabilis TaxID=109894 RepID=A0AAD5TIR2_9FUNG|nr:hypothetical protein HDU87_005691 [Geranomyces variabilis]
MSNSKLLTQRNWLRKRIAALAEDASDEGIKKKLQRLSDRALKMDEKGTSDYSEFLDVIYNNQDRIDTLENELLLLRRDYETLKEENTQLKMNADQAQDSALRRKIAINVEYELKLDYLRISSSDDIEELKYASGPYRGQFNPRSVTHLQLRRAKKLAQRNAPVADFERVRTDWFGATDTNLREALFIDAMSALKDEFTNAAHPIEYDGKYMTVEVARQLISNMRLLETDDPELRSVAREYADKLQAIRDATGEKNFLFR